MTRAEARALVIHCARLYPGKITVDDAVVETWANALADMTTDQADAAITEHYRTQPRNHVASPADLWAAHRTRTPSPAVPRPELGTADLPIAGPHEAPDIAHTELAKARAVLGPTRHRPPSRTERHTTKRTVDVKAEAIRQALWDDAHR